MNWRNNNPDYIKDYNKNYYIENKEYLNEKSHIYHEENKQIIAEVHSKYYIEHKEERKNYNIQYNQNNKSKKRSNSKKYKILRIQAIPKWANIKEIEKIYKQAQELELQDGIKRHVDHIIPLQGKNVCGLHVEYNLQILTEEENLKKSNKFDN